MIKKEIDDKETMAGQLRGALACLEDGGRVYGESGEGSLVAMFDDMNARWQEAENEVATLEKKFFQLAKHFQNLQKLWKQSKRDEALARESNQQLKKEQRQTSKKLEINRKRILELETELEGKDAEIDNLQEAIEMCRDVIFEKEDFQLPADTKKTLIRVCSRTQSMRTKKRTMNRVEETLESLEDDSNYMESFDDTGDLLDAPRRKGRRSDNHQSRIDRSLEEAEETNVLEMSISRCAPAVKRRSTQRLRRRSAEVEAAKHAEPDSFWAAKTPVKAIVRLGGGEKLPVVKGQLSSPNLAKHKWTKKRMMNLVPKPCAACGKKFALSSTALRCANCQITIHEQCQDRFREACNSSSAVTTRRPLAEYISTNQSPRIPACLYMAIHEVESRLHEEGIYRINGAQSEVQRLRQCFVNSEVRHDMLRQIIDTNAICSAIKDFFRNLLSEPILTYNLLPKFVQAWEHNDLNLAKDLFQELPLENRDTLGFLIIHLKNVITRSHANRMTHEALSKSVGPSIIGFTNETPNATEMLQASKYQEGVIGLLLSLPHRFYNSFLETGETTTEGTMSSLTTVSTGESLDAFGDQNTTCLEKRKRNLFQPPPSPSKPNRRTQIIDPSTPFKDRARLFK